MSKSMRECNKKVSIIVPVYNMEMYVEECVQSIINQTYKNIEIIIVDDGSVDNSGQICDDIQKNDARISVVHKANEGLSSARNAGMEQATGDYLMFVDSDDYLMKDAIEKLVLAIEKNDCSFAFCDMKASTDRIGEFECRHKSEELVSDLEFRAWLTNAICREYVLAVIVINKLFKREVIEDIRFDYGVYHEDEFFVNKLLEKRCNAVYLGEQLYYYRQTPGSITSSEQKYNIKHLDIADALDSRIEIAVELNDIEFTIYCFKLALIKLIRLYDEVRNDKVFAKQVIVKYDELFAKHKSKVPLKLRLKYKKYYRWKRFIK